MTSDELNALLRPHPPGVAMADEMLHALAEHLLEGSDDSPVEHAAWVKVIVDTIRMTEMLHGIRPE